ncbi:flagellin [Rhizobium sp. 2YAF20]|jgi:flagellin|uniref:flagellin N-terminal helical domain-containing protein n=1 Tax=Rhizobium sp. 2YAF20 TaxID=3233027 RepID=UPI003F9C2B3E
MGTVINSAALGALTVLRGVNKDLEKAQEQVSSTLRVQTAADDPSYWSMATTMRSDSSSLSTINDAMSLGANKLDTASTAMDSVISTLSSIQKILVSAQEPGADKTTLNQSLQQLKDTLQTTSQGASVAGENWLYNTDQVPDLTKSVISGFARGTSGQVYLQSVSYDGSQALMVDTADPSRGLLTKNIDANAIQSDGTSTARNYYLLPVGSGAGQTGGTEVALSTSTTTQQLNDMLDVVNSMLASATSAGSTMGVMQSRLDQQSSFISNLTDTLTTTIGSLVDTNQEEASARVTALKTAQQMGVQSLSIANTMASKVLILLQGK